MTTDSGGGSIRRSMSSAGPWVASGSTPNTSPPSMAGATLSGWPSIATASCSRSPAAQPAPLIALAASNPATMAVELLPNPLPTGTRL